MKKKMNIFIPILHKLEGKLFHTNKTYFYLFLNPQKGENAAILVGTEVATSWSPTRGAAYWAIKAGSIFRTITATLQVSKYLRFL